MVLLLVVYANDDDDDKNSAYVPKKKKTEQIKKIVVWNFSLNHHLYIVNIHLHVIKMWKITPQKKSNRLIFGWIFSLQKMSFDAISMLLVLLTVTNWCCCCCCCCWKLLCVCQPHRTEIVDFFEIVWCSWMMMFVWAIMNAQRLHRKKTKKKKKNTDWNR